MSDMMLELSPDDPKNDICDDCGLRRWWHEQNETRHTFKLKDDKGPKKLEPAPPPPKPMMLGDPVIRAALVKCGVLTEIQITEAEAWVREAARQGKALVIQEGSYTLKDAEAVAREVAENASP